MNDDDAKRVAEIRRRWTPPVLFGADVFTMGDVATLLRLLDEAEIGATLAERANARHAALAEQLMRERDGARGIVLTEVVSFLATMVDGRLRADTADRIARRILALADRAPVPPDVEMIRALYLDRIERLQELVTFAADALHNGFVGGGWAALVPDAISIEAARERADAVALLLEIRRVIGIDGEPRT